MYRSRISIKHGCLTHLFWGQDKDTGDYINIKDVEKNGLDCNCRCPVCEGDYVACIGQKVRRYFRHESKYRCMYTDEITTYLRAKKILCETKQVATPGVAVHFGSRTFRTDSCMASVENVFYHCEEEQYPPLLMATIDQRPTRIILAFAGYYKTEDLEEIKAEAIRNKWDCLLIALPKIDADDCISTAQLSHVIQTDMRRKVWLHCELAPYWVEQLAKTTVSPARISLGSSEDAFECTLHKQYQNGRYYATRGDCEKCQFNFGTGHACLCSAGSGITSLLDFEVSEELRMHRVEQIRAENEKAIADRAKEAEQRKNGFFANKTCPKCGRPLKRMSGKNGTTWLCVFGCKLHIFENCKTGELIMKGLD